MDLILSQQKTVRLLLVFCCDKPKQNLLMQVQDWKFIIVK